ncbi:RNA 2'-phosphotransferase [Roseibium sp. SCP14]|uniref:RNA 2'-phosphotransferase n=1 Tax=Roseibium sp. SCP14 TaxID=3141375 RepID=UPI00333A55E4
MKNDTKISRQISFWLRHKPDDAGLRLTSDGWVQVSELLEAFGRQQMPCSLQQLKQIVETNDKKRFEFSEDGVLIRARQGHSITIDLKLAPTEPPDLLYHGTATRFLSVILKEGLKPMNRHHVHLSGDADTARNVGARHGKPVVLVVASRTMQAADFRFFKTENGVWLVDHVPPEHLSCSGSE